MKSYKIIFSIALIVLFLTNIWALRECSHQQSEKNILQGQYDTALELGKAAPLRIIDTVYDPVANTSTTTFIPLRTTSQVSNFVSKGMADTMATALKVAVKEIESLKSMVLSLSGSGKGERIIDTNKKMEWLVMNNDPTFDVKVNLTNDSIYPSVNLRLTQAYAPYKKNIFSKTEYRSVIRASDSRVRISEIRDINKVPTSPRWGVSAFGGPMVHKNGFGYGFGVGLTYDLIQF